MNVVEKRDKVMHQRLTGLIASMNSTTTDVLSSPSDVQQIIDTADTFESELEAMVIEDEAKVEEALSELESLAYAKPEEFLLSTTSGPLIVTLTSDDDEFIAEGSGAFLREYAAEVFEAMTSSSPIQEAAHELPKMAAYTGNSSMSHPETVEISACLMMIVALVCVLAWTVRRQNKSRYNAGSSSA